MIRIKELREQKKISQQKLAIDLNISQASISKYEIGLAEPDIQTIIKLSHYFNVTTDYLLNNSDTKNFIDKNNLLNDEIEILSDYRKLDFNQKQKVQGYINGILEK